VVCIAEAIRPRKAAKVSVVSRWRSTGIGCHIGCTMQLDFSQRHCPFSLALCNYCPVRPVLVQIAPLTVAAGFFFLDNCSLGAQLPCAVRVIIGTAPKDPSCFSFAPTAAMKTSRSDLATLANICFSVRGILSCALALLLLVAPCLDGAFADSALLAAKDKKVKQDSALKGLPIAELSADEAILHALNRLAYGPRPGDVERIKQLGLAKWIDQQLNPNSIDDKALDARLENLPTLPMSSATLIAHYPQPKQAAKRAAKQTSIAQSRADAAERAGCGRRRSLRAARAGQLAYGRRHGLPPSAVSRLRFPPRSFGSDCR